MYLKTATAGAATIKAIRASGVIVQVEPSMLVAILAKAEMPLVVMASSRFLSSQVYQYLTNYKGFLFFAEAKEPLELPEAIELVAVEKIWIPDR